MIVLRKAVAALLCLAAGGMVQAADVFKPETFTVEAQIKPGPNLFLLDQRWSGASRVNVVSADDLSNKGLMSIGLVGQFALTQDRRTAYTASSYAKRIAYGAEESVLQEFDVATLSVKREIALPPKTAQTLSQTALLRLSADERFALVMNATPAASVTVVDLQAGKQVSEVPTPGCWGIFPSPDGQRFSSLCGDGTLATYTYAADGTFTAPVKSDKFFDGDSDPLYTHAERVGKEWLFLSFHGNLFRVNDAAAKASVVSKFALTEGVKGGWAPGGMQVMAYNPSHQVLFVSMHPDAKEGSHKEHAKEVWAVDLKKPRVLYRSVVEPLSSLVVTDGPRPVLFGLSEEGTVQRFEIDPEAKFAAKPTHKALKVGEYMVGATGGAL